jgi:ABC-type phosphate transport system substrate-binding protein
MRSSARVLVLLAVSVMAQPASSYQASQSAGPDPARQAGPSTSLAIVVNTSNPVQDLSFVELRRIFLGERSHWPNRRRITLVMMEPGEPERREVLHDICRMSEDEFRRHFLQRLFTGEAIVSPKTLASPAGVRKFVFNVPGAIGYVRASDVDSSVKIVRIDGRLPDDKDYRLQLDPRPTK